MKRMKALHDPTEDETRRLPPRLLSRQQAAAYCGLSARSFSDWVAKGRMPQPLPQTSRWDLRAIDSAIDLMSGNTTSKQPLDVWRASRARRHI